MFSQPKRSSADVYGTCGSFYLVEKLEPLPLPRRAEGAGHFSEFGARAKTAMKVMDLAEELDSVFEEPLLLCDVKADHFGISEHGRVKVLDSDAVFPKSIAGKLYFFAVHTLQKIPKFLHERDHDLVTLTLEVTDLQMRA